MKNKPDSIKVTASKVTKIGDKYFYEFDNKEDESIFRSWIKRNAQENLIEIKPKTHYLLDDSEGKPS